MKKTLYFSSDAEFEAYYGASGKVPAGEIAVVGDYKKVYTSTNNIDGTSKDYEAGIPESGSINITENGENIDVAEYATANVNVPIPAGYIVPTGSKSITANGEAIDVAEYATANVNVPIPAGYIQPTGNYAITENGTNIDIAQYATVSVAVESSAPSLTWNTLSGNNLEMTVGTTYVFKTNVAGVYMFHLGIDTDSDGDIDLDDEAYALGQMVANTEYYFTALNEQAGAGSNTHSYMLFAGSSYNRDAALPAGAVVQYAVVS